MAGALPYLWGGLVNLDALRQYCGSLLDYDPVNPTYTSELTSFLNDAQGRLLGDRPWAFLVREEQLEVKTDITLTLTFTAGSAQVTGTSFPVGTDNPTIVVEHDDRVANMIEQRLVRERTEFIDTQRQCYVGVQRQHESDACRREREGLGAEAEEVVRKADCEWKQCADEHQHNSTSVCSGDSGQPGKQGERRKAEQSVRIRRVDAHEPITVGGDTGLQTRAGLDDRPDHVVPGICEGEQGRADRHYQQ